MNLGVEDLSGRSAVWSRETVVYGAAVNINCKVERIPLAVGMDNVT